MTSPVTTAPRRRRSRWHQYQSTTTTATTDLHPAIQQHESSTILNPPSITSMPEIKNNTVDRVFSLAGLHHLTTLQKQQFFEEVHRILRPGGMLVVADVMSKYVRP